MFHVERLQSAPRIFINWRLLCILTDIIMYRQNQIIVVCYYSRKVMPTENEPKPKHKPKPKREMNSYDEA